MTTPVREPADRRELLAVGLATLGLDPTDERLDRLLRYVDEIELWNPRLKLVAASGRDLIVRHILDSVAPVPHLKKLLARLPGRIADMGSGAGLPGLPLAIVEPEFEVDLVERSGRRVGFLRNARAVLRTSNVTIHHADVRDYSGPASLIVHRAFLPLSAELLFLLFGELAPGGAVCAYKGRRAAVEEELAHVRDELRERSDSGADKSFAVRIEEVDVPFLEEQRHLVVITPG